MMISFENFSYSGSNFTFCQFLASQASYRVTNYTCSSVYISIR